MAGLKLPKYSIQIHQAVIICISALVVLGLYLLLSTNLTKWNFYQNFFGQSIGAETYFTSNSAVNNALSSNRTYLAEYLNFTNHGDFNLLLNTTEKTYSSYLTPNYASLLQIILVVCTTLLGLYAVIFVEIIKSLNKRYIGNKKIYDYIKYLLILISVLPFPFLLVSISNVYTSFVIYQHLLLSSTIYYSNMYAYDYANINSIQIIGFSNISRNINPTNIGNLKVIILNHTIYNNSAIPPNTIPVRFLQNTTTYFYLHSISNISQSGITNILSKSSQVVTPMFLYQNLIDFITTTTGLFNDVGISMLIIMINLFLYLIYLTNSQEKQVLSDS